MGFENPFHLLFIAVVALVVLGPRRLPELARAAGKSMREFRDALNGEGGEHEQGHGLAHEAQPVDPHQPESAPPTDVRGPESALPMDPD